MRVQMALWLLLSSVSVSSETDDCDTANYTCVGIEKHDYDLKSCVALDSKTDPYSIIIFSIRFGRFLREYIDEPSENEIVKKQAYHVQDTVLERHAGFISVNYLQRIGMRDFIEEWGLTSHRRDLFMEKTHLQPFFTDIQEVCFSSSEKLIIFRKFKLTPFNKCCAKGERLNRVADECEPIPGKIMESVDQEIIDLRENRTENSWVPEEFSNVILKAKYNFIKNRSVYKWNTMAAASRDQRWSFSDYTLDTPAKLKVSKERNRFVNVTEGETEFFCFDDVAEGPLAPGVLLAAVYDIRKCCGKGEQFDHLSYRCVQRPDQSVADDVIVDSVDWEKNPKEAYWVPNSLLQKKRRTVNYIGGISKAFFFPLLSVYDDNLWTFDGREVKMNVTFVSGESVIVRSKGYCLEFIADAVKVLLVEYTSEIRRVLKCCYPGEIISSAGFCMKYNSTNWTPGLSKARSHYKGDEVPVANVLPPLKTQCRSFHTQLLDTSKAIPDFDSMHWDAAGRKVLLYCQDFQETSDGLQEVVGSCSIPPLIDLYESIRPLGVLSALLLAAAAMLALSQEETRSSIHGRALACHALCLSVASTLQLVWYFTNTRFGSSCKPYMYSTYFFMIAANLWLSAISVNMAQGFLRPLSVMARVAVVKREGGLWKPFAYLSLFAWGGSVALTVFAISMHLHKEYLQQLGYVPPSFFETRTCAFENSYNTDVKDFSVVNTLYGDVQLSGRLGSLYYYYVPMTLLVATNGICVVLTARTVLSLQSDKTFLQRDCIVSKDRIIPQQPLQNARLYAKLLFTSGIVELILEGVAWQVGRIANQRPYDVFKNANIFAIAATFLDFARAVVVLWLCSARSGCGLGTIWKKTRARFGDVLGTIQQETSDTFSSNETHIASSTSTMELTSPK